MKLRNLLWRRRSDPLADVSRWQRDIHDAVLPYTMTGSSRIYALIDAVSYIEKAGIPGAIVECGVWRGGSMMACALALKGLKATNRELYLFDTFTGMTPPTVADVDSTGVSALDIIRTYVRGQNRLGWCEAPLLEVQENMRRTGYPSDRIHLVQGPVESTIPENAPKTIALLRLDTDWYESTRHELDHLYERIPPGGVIIIDDYGHWQGARRAVDEFLEQRNIACLMHRIDYTARIFIKPLQNRNST